RAFRCRRGGPCAHGRHSRRRSGGRQRDALPGHRCPLHGRGLHGPASPGRGAGAEPRPPGCQRGRHRHHRAAEAGPTCARHGPGTRGGARVRRGQRRGQGKDQRRHGLHRCRRGARGHGRRPPGGRLIEPLINWLATLPPAAVYIVLALLAAVENIIPPVPADTAVALGAFLSHRGVTTLPLVFAVTWTANMLGAAGIYFAARRYGRRLFATPAGRRLLAPGAIAAIEREYLRFGVFGIFLGRFLPGIRAVVAPFAGLANLSAPRALIPMGIASAIWYGGVAFVGSAIGANWAEIEALIRGLNLTLGAVALVLLIVIAIVVLVRRRQRGRQPLWGALRRAFHEP